MRYVWSIAVSSAVVVAVAAAGCDRAHVDVYVTGHHVGGRFEASHVIGFNNHRYDPSWVHRCSRPVDETHFE